MSQIKANALTDVDVSFVSLVKRGANRIPFRIKKEDATPMIDLDKMFFRKGDDAAKAAKLAKTAAAEKLAKDGAGLTGTMPIPTNAAEALTAAQELLKANGFSVMVAQAEAAIAAPTAKAAVAADQAASESDVKKAADNAAFMEMIAAQKAKKDKAAAKKAEAEAEEAAADLVLVELEKAAQKATPQALAAKVNAGKPNPIVNGGTGFKDGTGDADGGADADDDAISAAPVNNRDGQTDSKATMAIVMKLEATVAKAIADLAALVKASTEATAKRLDAVEVSTKKADGIVSRVVLGGETEDAKEMAVRKSASACPPLLDTSLPGWK